MDHYENKYDRFNKILGITTTSLYGKSIMYDRLKCLKYLGLTKGNSTYEINDAVSQLCKKFLEENYTTKIDSKKKLHYLTIAFKHLGIPLTYLQSNSKGIYFGFTCKDSKEFLNGESTKCPNLNKKKYNIKTAQEIYDEWIDRWASQRFDQLQKTNRFVTSCNIYDKNLKNNSKYLINNNKLNTDENNEIINEIKNIDNKKINNIKQKNIIKNF